MDIFQVLASWARWMFDAFGVNVILKKIAQIFTSKNGEDSGSDNNLLTSPKRPQSGYVSEF
ncbi:hypothetical protein GCM10027577_38740 [Spirosoma fluminis]